MQIELLDAEGVRFPISVTATTDNSLLTLQPFLTRHRDDVQLVQREGKPVMLLSSKAEEEPPPTPAAPTAAPTAGALAEGAAAEDGAPAPTPTKAKAAKAKAAEAAKAKAAKGMEAAMAVYAPPTRSVEERDGLAREVHRAASLVMPYVCSSLMQISDAGSAFPLAMVQARGRPIFDLVEVLAGKAVPMPPAPQDRKNDKQLVRHLHASYDGLVAFLRAHGAMLAALKSDHLLGLADFLTVAKERHAAAANGDKSKEKMPRKQRKQLEAEHKLGHVEAWLEIVLQVVKTLVLARITPKSFRLLPGVTPAEAAEVLKDPTLAGSNVYTPSEGLVRRRARAHCSPHARVHSTRNRGVAAVRLPARELS